MAEPLDARVRAIETQVAVHEAVCAERYKAIALRLNILLSILLALVGAAAAGNPLIALLGRLFTP